MAEVREEVLNVALADLLARRGLMTIPEQIVKSTSGGRRLPDITVGDISGIRITIEGRFDGGKTVRAGLSKDAKARVEEGVSPLCLAVLYPSSLRATGGYAALRRSLEKASFSVRAFSETQDGEWMDAGVDGIAEILRASYELLVSEDVVWTAVEDLRTSIDFASGLIRSSPAAPVRLRRLLGIPEERRAAAESDEPEDE